MSLSLHRGLAIGVTRTTFWFLVSDSCILGLGRFYSLLSVAQSIQISTR